jgi:DUF1680 family protein
MKYTLILFLFLYISVDAQKTTRLNAFPLQDVKLLPGIFKDAEITDFNYMMAMSPDRLLAPYRREAGLRPKAKSYPNWEDSGLDGHMAGHYLSALSMMYASTGNNRLLERLDYMISELKICQDKNGDGYVGGVPGSKELWAQVKAGNLTDFNKKWVPFYNVHKVFAGLRDAYLYTGNKTAKLMLIRFADWFVGISSSLSQQKMQEILQTEQGGINEVLADVYGITGDKKYLLAAYSFSHQSLLLPLESGHDELNNLHANTQIPKVIGFKRIADLNNDTSYNKASQFFWQTVTEHRSIAIGGNSVREHFNPSDDFSTMIASVEGPETCNSYNMLKLTEALYLSDPKPSYIDYYERVLYNHILSSERIGKGGFVYFTPMRPGHYRVYSQPQSSMWCCVGTGMENHAKYGKLIYAYKNNDLYVNLFIASQLNWRPKGLKLTQSTSFPESENTTIKVDAVTNGAFCINIRYPSWVKAGKLTVLVNGKKLNVAQKPSTYIAIKRTWKKGDIVSVHLPMQNTIERLPDSSNYEAVLHGPIVLASIIDTNNMEGLLADSSRMGHVANGKLYPLQEMPMFVNNSADDAALIKQVPGKLLTFTAPKLIYPTKFSSLKLIPFYKIQSARYVIYWQRETTNSISAIQKKLSAKEDSTARLAAMTIDLVNPGEQQPEADHFIENENSSTGVNNNRHYRNATGWFTYNLTDKNKRAGILRVTYLGSEKNHKFSILINDQLIAKVNMDNPHGSGFFTEDYVIPENILQSSNGVLKTKFLADAGSVTGSVYEVRLLKKE